MNAEENYGFPPTYKLILKNLLPAGRLKILDFGCGTGVAGDLLNPKKIHEFIGVDIYKPYLEVCRKKGNYKRIIKADITKMKIKEKSFDVILLLQVIEHLEKKAAKDFIKKAIKAAKKCIIISAPNGKCYQEEYDGSIHHRHISTWTPLDLKQLGFRVYGQGLKIIYGSESYGGGQGAKWWQKIAVCWAVILLPIIMIYPRIGAQLIGVKYLNKGNKK